MHCYSLIAFVPLALVAARPAPESPRPITVPLTRNTRPAPEIPARWLAKRNLPLVDFQDALYYGNGTVGNQTFQFVFDTGSSDVFVPDPECALSQCGTGERYNHGGKDLNKTVDMAYGSGEVEGYLYQDTVTADGRTAHNQVLVSAGLDTLLAQSDANALIGLAFPGVSKTNGTPFFDNLMAQGAVPKPEIGLFYGRQGSTENLSEIVFGGRNPRLYSGAFTELPVLHQFYWSVGLERVEVMGKCVGNATVNNFAAIDSGTQNIVAPRAAAAAMFAAIPGAQLDGNSSAGGSLGSVDRYVYPCNTSAQYMPSLVMGGKPFPIDARDFNAGDNTNFAQPGYCDANVFGVDVDAPGTPNLWIVGDVFLRSWYAVFNHQGSQGKPVVELAAVAQNATKQH